MKKYIRTKDGIYDLETKNNDGACYKKELKTLIAIKQSLLELKAIKEAEPSEAFERLESFFNSRKIYEFNNIFVLNCIKSLNTIKASLQELEKENAEYKKILEIIKNKCLTGSDNLLYVRFSNNYDEYKKTMSKKYDTVVVKIDWKDKDLLDYLKLFTDEEFNTLKRWSEK